MNRSGIEYCDYTLNIITGCRYDCPYCYARAMSKRFSGNIKKHKVETEKFSMENEGYVLDKAFINEEGTKALYPFGFEPTFHRYSFSKLDKLKMGKNIFVGAMGDMFGDFISDEWIYEVFENCKAYPKNNYMFMTKNPARYSNLQLPEGTNMFYGTSISKKEDVHRVMLLPENRKKYVAIEPLHEEIGSTELETIAKNVDWIIVGTETGLRTGKIAAKKEWVENIVKVAREKSIPVFMRDNLSEIIKGELVQEFPEELKRKELSDKVKAKLISNCAVCGKELRKNKMITVNIRKKRCSSMRKLCHVCESCLLTFCEKYNLEIPKLEED